MVLQADIYPGGYKQESYSHDGYYSSGYGHCPSMHMYTTPYLGSSHMMHSGGHGPYHQITTDFYSDGLNGHMSSAFTTDSNLNHGMPTANYGSSYHGASSNFSHGMPTGSYGSSYHGANSNFSHGMPTGSYGSSYHGASPSPMGSKIESMKHEYNNYNYGRPSMLHTPMHGGHQSAEWKLKSIEDDD
ncbi:hypothetical protein DCAR_0207966 [Daucus carota subsp. sativus]|uniref:Uncharacterized protein n=1 Tax=Daucus carota subsp. sativus TaxID=79200 RepID=A0AAF0WG16_DAUCS|nr:PREDICTED: prisilkin-39-like [Daucus carota subsp. sativus]WOG88731.1 hypothetical protein DCAR_0207966 [Daucus carota subsp. sativus]